jgi:heme oxygenase (biliverdin-IX-beta and delta-forming)
VSYTRLSQEMTRYVRSTHTRPTVPDLLSFAASRTSPPSDPLAALRSATRAHHERIDSLVNLQRLQDPTHYAQVLQAFDAFLAGWEPAVAAALPRHLQEWLRARSRRHFLRDDLRVLGLDAPRPAELPPLADRAAAWGSIYVMEGSALGGQLITSSLAQVGVTPSNGAAYFHGWGERTGDMWREVRQLLASELGSDPAMARACDAARGTFAQLTSLLERTLHERAALV